MQAHISRVTPALILALVSATLLIGAQSALAQAPVDSVAVETFAPQGEVRQIRQVAVRFTADMVALGASGAPAPLKLECSPGSPAAVGRWVDARRFVFEWPRDLPVGTRCQVSLQNGVQSLAGRAVVPAGPWLFSTGGPKIAELLTRDAREQIREDQIFLIRADAVADQASVDRHLKCEVKGSQANPMQRLTAAEGMREMQAYRRDFTQAEWERNGWMALRCAGPLPNATPVRLIWGAAIATPNQVASGSDQITGFTTRPPFNLQISCAVLAFTPGCDTRQALLLQFSAPVPVAMLERIRLATPEGKPVALVKPPPGVNSVTSVTAELLAVSDGPASITATLRDTVRDADGRTLANADRFPKTIGFARKPAYVGFVNEGMQVLPRTSASGAPAQLVVAARHVEAAVAVQAARISGLQGETGEKAALALLRSSAQWPQQGGETPYPVLRQLASQLPQPLRMSLATSGGPMAFTGLPLTQPGMWLVELDSPRHRGDHPSGRNPSAPRATLVQVTDLNVTARISTHGRSLVWVTGLTSGKPVPDVSLAVYDCADREVWRGRSAADGSATFDVRAECAGSDNTGTYHVVARKDDDMVVLDLARMWGANQPAPGIGHVVLDRTLLKAGETLHLESHVRGPVASGFAILPPFSGTLEVRHQSGEVVHRSKLSWDAQGCAQASWTIPTSARLGQYTVRVRHADFGADATASLQVEEFRAPVFDASLAGTAQWRTPQEQVLPMAASVRFFAGGAAAGAQVTLKGQWRMGAPPLRAGFDFLNRRIAPFAALPLMPRRLQLDQTGAAAATITPPPLTHAVSLFAEMEFADPNGEVQTVANSFAVWPSPNRIGIKAAVLPHAPGSAAQAQRGVQLSGVMLGPDGQPIAGKAMRFSVTRARPNNAGYYDLFGTESGACEAVTDGRGEAHCVWQVPPPASGKDNGQWLFSAKVEGEKHVATTLLYDWDLAWQPTRAVLEVEGLNLQDAQAMLTADSPAMLRVRAPFAPATLLLTVEREGVLAHSVHALASKDERIALALAGHYAPNVLVSATLVSALRDGSTGADGTPKLSSGETIHLRVKPSAYSLALTVVPRGNEFRPRGRALVDLSVRDQAGKPLAGARITVVVVDEALLALKDNPTWALLTAMTRHRASDVRSQSVDALLSRQPALGPQHAFRARDERLARRNVDIAGRVEDKFVEDAPPSPPPMPAPMAMMAARGAPAEAKSGDGSPPPVRSDFSSLALWQTDVVADANGHAAVEVPLNDSLTRWRVVAIATQGAGRFGTGEATLTTTQPLQLVSGLPGSVRSGDALEQKVTLRNTSPRALEVAFEALATLEFDGNVVGVRRPEGAALAARGLQLARKFKLKAGENRDFIWPVSVPDGTRALRWRIAAQAADLGDIVEVTQVVTPAVPVTVRQATLLQVTGNADMRVTQPPGALPQTGGVSLAWKASLTEAALTEVRKWMAAYPFACLEQKASRAAALRDRQGWDSLMSELPKYVDRNGLVRYFPTEQLPGSEVLTLYLLDTAAALGWPIPAEQRVRLLKGVRDLHEGKAKSLDWAPRETEVSSALARQATLAEQQPDISTGPRVQPREMDRLPTTSVIDWVRFLLASPRELARAQSLQAAAALLRSRYDIQGTRLNWRSEEHENWWWFMWNGNVAAARTAWVVTRWSREDAGWNTDLPLLVNGLIGRQRNGHWGTTTANAWGSLALAAFTTQRESVAVRGASIATLGGSAMRVDWQLPGASTEATLPWPGQGSTDTLHLSHQGSGAPWASIGIRAAVKLDSAVSQGLSVTREVTPVEQKTKGTWSVGDIMRVKLAMRSNADLGWVVVRDPVPSGATILGRGLARESALAQSGTVRGRGNWPAFEERAAESYRAYFRQVDKGDWSVEYNVRINNAGRFEFPPTRIEAMYAPEIFGETPIAALVAKP